MQKLQPMGIPYNDRWLSRYSSLPAWAGVAYRMLSQQGGSGYPQSLPWQPHTPTTEIQRCLAAIERIPAPHGTSSAPEGFHALGAAGRKSNNSTHRIMASPQQEIQKKSDWEADTNRTNFIRHPFIVRSSNVTSAYGQIQLRNFFYPTTKARKYFNSIISTHQYFNTEEGIDQSNQALQLREIKESRASVKSWIALV